MAWLLLVPLLIGLPLAGVLLAGHDLQPYLQLPPRPVVRPQPGFSWPVFCGLGVVVLVVLLPLYGSFRAGWPRLSRCRPSGSFPFWGWAGLSLTAVSWLLAWNRFPWFAPLQAYTFFPLWLGYILSVSAVTARWRGTCALATRPGFILRLFAASSLFWWFFEYLNRFVANWIYLGVEDFSPLAYTAHASLCFATVLPAVYATAELLAAWPELWDGLAHRRPLVLGRVAGTVLVLVASAGLLALGRWPQYTFPLVWIAPGLLLAGADRLGARRSALLAALERGDWRPLAQAAVAALVCGFFWEMWNSRSLAHWEYAVPFVDRFHLFFMPIVGYGGYLPFGVECALVWEGLATPPRHRRRHPTGRWR